ncbi:MAG: DNA mismatch repair protein MutS [Planctomycetota bacterium]|jgi:DNA mismatch repair protein MutS|nr:DNA mismatch repair protein MutS [Planctomycetota bacterium]
MPDDKITPAMRQWRSFKDRHPDKILLFRMGDFYETFHDDAVQMHNLLGLTLTRRGKEPGAPPLAGIPYQQLTRYVKMLVDKGRSVVIADQLEEAAGDQGVVRRGITEVVTPGTLMEESALPHGGNNYLAAISLQGGVAALAFLDLSTGDFLVVMPPAGRVDDELARFSPAELLASRSLLADPGPELAAIFSNPAGGRITRRDDYAFDPREGETRLKNHFRVDTVAGFGLEEPAALGAAGAALGYLEENQSSDLAHLRPPRTLEVSGRLRLDRNSIRNLELARPPGGGDAGATLLSVLDRTLTGPGGRMLRSWLLSPSARLDVIRPRQEAVAELMADADTRRELRGRLDRFPDLERIMARVATGRATPRDLAALSRGCLALPGIAGLAGNGRAPLLRECLDLDTLGDVGGNILRAIGDDPPAGVRDGGIVRAGYDPAVDELRAVGAGGSDWLRVFQANEQARTGIPSLKVGKNRVFGYYIEISNAHRGKAPADYIRKQTLVNAERYITPELKAMEERFQTAEGRLAQLEYEIFIRVERETALAIPRAQRAAEKIAELDVVLSLAEVGAERGYVMPEMHDGVDAEILGGRHPVAETLLPAGEFVANDLAFDPRTQRVLIVTGPNMAGKSTYIRQAALLFVMAQMGAPIPAQSARIGLADRIFTRVGAADDLSRGRSTFMVEMLELAEILQNAGEKSLVVLDEVGRGTSTFDGVSLAWAATEYLHSRLKARTLFATHYHELAELGHLLDAAKNFNVSVREWGDEVVFLREIRPGAADRSYGIQVARIAGVPGAVVRRADEILRGLEAQAGERDWKMLQESRELLRAAAREVQLELFAPPKKMDELAREITVELSKLDADRLSPLEALGVLARLIAKARGK